MFFYAGCPPCVISIAPTPVCHWSQMSICIIKHPLHPWRSTVSILQYVSGSCLFTSTIPFITKCLCGVSVQVCQCVACAGEGIISWWARRTVRFLRWWCTIAPSPSSSCRVTVRASCGPWRFILPNLSPWPAAMTALFGKSWKQMTVIAHVNHLEWQNYYLLDQLFF